MVRKQMEHEQGFLFSHSQDFLTHGYKELTFPATKNGGYASEKGALHLWPRGENMLIALPNMDKSFTVTLFLAYEGGKYNFGNLNNKEIVDEYFSTIYPDAYNLMPELDTEFFENPTAALGTVRCSPWYHKKTLIMGDAAHAIVPFYGQGMNAGFEDCRIFVETLEQYNFDWSIAMDSYHRDRKKNTDAIAYLALTNFIEMRDHVNSDRFLAQKKLEAALHKAYPEDWLPLYSMVTFSEIPYSEALKLGEIQQELLNEIIEVKDFETINMKKLIESFKSRVLNAQTTSQ
jgi:kynurenine 3-monooxygenase